MTYPKYNPHRSSLGMDANLAVLIVWFGAFIVSLFDDIAFLAFLVPFLIFFIEKDSQLVKNHALQAMSLFIFNLIAAGLILFFPVLGFIFWIIAIVELALIIVAAQRGWYYHDYNLPFLGPIAGVLRKYLIK